MGASLAFADSEVASLGAGKHDYDHGESMLVGHDGFDLKSVGSGAPPQ